MGRILVGTAGFSYRDWDGVVYPDPRPPGFQPLSFLAGFFDCIEMNVSFYRVPAPTMVERWVELVADRPDFAFAFKLYRGVTHDGEDGAIPGFLDALRPAREAGRLGAILVQFPFWFRNGEASRKRLATLARGLEGWPVALEIRDHSWLADPALDYLRRLSFNLASIDICQTRDSVPPVPLTTGPLGYVRLHGRNAEAWFAKGASRDAKYDYLYSPAELEEWARRVEDIAARTDSTYVITNNHFGGKAVANAFQLARRLTGAAPAPPDHLARRFPQLAETS